MLDEFRSTNITWDKATSRIYSPVTANASDENGRKLVVQIVNGGQVEDLTGATLHLYWETRDKLHDGLDVFKAVDLEKGEFELSYTTGMLSNKGVLNANLVLIDTVGRVVSERFKITVTEGIDGDAIQSEKSFSSLTQALIDISNLEQNYAPRLNDLTAQLHQTDSRIADIILTNDLSPNKDPEIVDARAGERTLGAKIVRMDNKLNDITNTYDEPTTEKILTPYKSGYWWDGVEHVSSTYFYTGKIPVKEGDVISLRADGNPQPHPMRFIQAYNGEQIINEKSTSTDTTSFTVPEGVDGLIISAYSIYQDLKTFFKDTNIAKHELKIDRENFTFTAVSNTLLSNIELVAAERIDNKKNCSYLFNGFFTSFGILKIGHGKTEYGSVYLTIDGTNIKTYSHTGALFQTLPHGLTLQDYIHVNIKVADTATARATVVIRTNGGDATIENVIFFGCNGDVYASSTTAMTDAKLQYAVPDMKKDVFIFGDSYATLSDNARWPHHLLTAGYTNMMINGFGGATSANALVTFKNIVRVQKPKYVVWLLGMNDPDTTVVNASWKSAVDYIVSYCQSADIIPILATIPNTPTMNNLHKNTYVRGSGLRYVDFSKAVNGDSANAPWYGGMLSADNVHPAEKGAKALASRLLIDVPEIIS